MFRIITGIVVIIIGLLFITNIVDEGFSGTLPGIVIMVIGIAILLNKDEDKIEEVNNDKE
jgi:uncharacterized membrane protein